MIKQMAPFILIPMLITFGVGFFIEKNKLVAGNYKEYCEVRTELAMNVYDEIKRGLPLYEINVFWEKSSVDEYHTYSRAKWWKDLKDEVGLLVREGKLSFRVKEIVMQRCVADTGVMVYYKKYKGVVPNEINS